MANEAQFKDCVRHFPAPVSAMWYLYIIQNGLTKELYIGVTNNPKRRILQHNAGQSPWTKRDKGVWVYVYLELYRSKDDAFTREHKLKHHGSGLVELKKRIKGSLFS